MKVNRKQKIRDFVEYYGHKPFTINYVSELLGINYGTVQPRILELVKAGTLKKVHKQRYQYYMKTKKVDKMPPVEKDSLNEARNYLKFLKKYLFGDQTNEETEDKIMKKRPVFCKELILEKLKESPLSMREISESLNLPIGNVKHVVRKSRNAGILEEIKSERVEKIYQLRIL